jgi:hypothetical protein
MTGAILPSRIGFIPAVGSMHASKGSQGRVANSLSCVVIGARYAWVAHAHEFWLQCDLFRMHPQHSLGLIVGIFGVEVSLTNTTTALCLTGFLQDAEPYKFLHALV